MLIALRIRRPFLVLALEGEVSAQAAVVGAFDLGREQTGWQLAMAFVVKETLATKTLSGTRIICAIAATEVLVVISAILTGHPFSFRYIDAPDT
jgi:hypothetical protein